MGKNKGGTPFQPAFNRNATEYNKQNEQWAVR